MSPQITEDEKWVPRRIVEDVLGKRDTKELWGAGYFPALPITPQSFSLGGVLPAVFYMMRWAQRRGVGQFAKVFGDPSAPTSRGKRPSVSQVATRLAGSGQEFVGFQGNVQQAILSDLLLAYCLENQKHETGRDEIVQRVFPTHYFASWVDLPETAAHLRGVPELLVAILARQACGATILRSAHRNHYSIGTGFTDNLLLSLFGPGALVEGQVDNLKSDRFEESAAVGLDQLLTIRIAKALGGAPTKVRGENPQIPNQLPVALLAADHFYEDFNVFLRAYGRSVPRQALLPMLESCLTIGLSNIYLSSVRLILQWGQTGVLLGKAKQESWPLFVDCSLSVDRELRRYSEECVDDLLQRLARLPVCMMCLKVLAQYAQAERIPGLPAAEPDPTNRINFLGDLLLGRLDESRDMARDIRRNCTKLSEVLKDSPESNCCELLKNDEIPSPWRLAEVLVVLMGDSLQFGQYRKFLDSCLMIDQPNGVARKRRTPLKRKWADRRSVVLTDSVLDFLVHRHLVKPNKNLSQADLPLVGFLEKLRGRYGLYVDVPPPGFSIPDEILRRNRAFLERRLRDMGLFMGVNDAESMKRLRPRFEAGNCNGD